VPGHLQQILDVLQETAPGSETDLGAVLHELVPRIHRRGLIVIFSDCFGDVTELMRAIAHFRHHHHEVLVFQIWDPDELDFPFKKWSRFDSLENADDRQMIDHSHLRDAYLINLEKFRAELKEGCGRHQIDLVPISTDRPFAEALAQYLMVRLRSSR